MSPVLWFSLGAGVGVVLTIFCGVVLSALALASAHGEDAAELRRRPDLTLLPGAPVHGPVASPRPRRIPR